MKEIKEPFGHRTLIDSYWNLVMLYVRLNFIIYQTVSLTVLVDAIVSSEEHMVNKTLLQHV